MQLLAKSIIYYEETRCLIRNKLMEKFWLHSHKQWIIITFSNNKH